MRKLLHTLFFLSFLLISFQSKAQVTGVTVDAGPYTQGSTIAATFNIGTDCIGRNNTFELYLSDATGDFTNQRLIGSYVGFYATFVNGIIPVAPPILIPGNGYKVRVRSTSNGLYSTESNTFTIGLGTAVTASVTSTPINGANPETYGFCANRTGSSANVFLTNQSTANGTATPNNTVSAAITNELDGGAVQQIIFNGGIKTFLPGAAHYTMMVKVLMPDGRVATKAYFIINNVVNTAFSTTGSGLVCLPVGELSYGVDYLGANGIQKNFPGNLYHIDWGDNSQNDYTLCELSLSGTVKHNYTESSCGSSFNGKFNVFGINITTNSPFCGAVGQPLSTSAKVVTVTKNEFTGPATACTNTDVTFVNISLPGQNQNDGSMECVDNDVKYNWYVDGQIVLPNVTKAENFVYMFPAGKIYTIMLESVSSGTCQGEVFTRTICIQNAPEPSFTLPSAEPLTICTPGIVTPTNTTILDTNCDPTVTWFWTVTPVVGGGAITYANGTTINSREPSFNFTIPGEYSVRLTVTTASCGEFSTSLQPIIVNGPPTATLAADAKLCTNGIFRFNETAGPTQTAFTGTFDDLPTTYTWTVTGGAYEFVENTTLNSKFPSIRFDDFAEYTITVTHTNTCNTFTDTQVITFTQAPTINLGPAQNICFTDNASLNPVVTGTLTNPVWSGGAGTYTYDATTGIGTYTPSAQEKAAGAVTLTYSGTTDLAEPCNVISQQVVITIKPQIIITSPATATICTATPLNYQPTATPATTTFSWTATGTANAGGFANSATATETGPITDNLTNSDPLNDATVTYIITPTNDGCVGDAFTLIVTVKPRPIITVTGPTGAICSGSASGITITSNLTGTTYTWTSIATAGITGNSDNASADATGTISQTLTNTTRTQGSVKYTITPTSANNCPGAPFEITVLVDPTVTQANAGPNASICEQTEYTLQGNTPDVGETGLWSLVSGPASATFVDATLYNTRITNLIPGETYVLQWRITGSGSCPFTTANMTIVVNIPTVGGTTTAVGATTVCSGANTGSITLAGNVGAVLYWQSSTDGGANWVDIVNNTSTLTYNNITAPTLYRAVVQNGTCDIRFSTATPIAVTPPTTIPNAGTDQTLCAELSTVLTGNTPATGETGLWERISGPASITITNPAGPQTTVTGLTAGATYVFRWTITGQSPCGSLPDEVTVTNLLPLTNTINSSTTEVCNGKIITITGDQPTGGSGTYSYSWEVSTDGTNWSIIPTQSDRDLNYQMLTTSSFRRTVTSSTCILVSNVIRIVAQPPLANNTIAADQTICTGLTPAPLTGSLPTGSDGNYSYQWQLSENNGATWANIVAAVGQNYIPPSLTTTTLFRRVVSTNACDGDLRNISTPVTITVKPDAKAEYTFTIDKACTPFVIDANNIRAVAYPDRNASYTWFANGVQIGTGITFPGYTIATSDQSVTIKLVAAPSQGCQASEFEHVFSTNQSVAASFTQSATQGCSPLVVNFVNTSTSLTNATFRWDFGNGTTSTQTMPGAVTFLEDPTGKDTTYTVTLTAITSCGSTSVTSTVFVKALPRAIFSPSRTTGCSPMTVTFSNTSPGGTNTYYYDFGDGTLLTKTDKSPVQHTFITNVVRDFVVKLVAENDCGRDESSYTIRVAPNTVLPELVVNANEKEGCAPFLVNFYNNSRGANLFRYDFGDGSTLLTRSAPEVVQHTFTRPGTYTIVLTASNGCSDTTTTESITVLPQPLAAFSADNTLGCPGLAVKFRNTSTDGVSYLWDFGDGTTSNEFEPTHVFNADQEFYTISLTATNALGCTYTATLNQYIRIVAPPVALFNVAPSTLISIPNYTFRFEDESTNNPTIWLWDFGDKTTSTLQNPSHTYLDTGTYVVTLRVSNQQGCFTTTFKNVTIVGVPGYLYVPNSFMPGSETPELRTFIAKGSGIKSWTFSVFNKWGQTLWQTTKLDEGRPVEGWDGMFNGVLQPQGVYFWKIDVEFINGTAWKGVTYDSSAPKKTGVIHLIR